MPRPALRVGVSKKDQESLKKVLAGGIEQVRVAMRAVALLRLAEGMGAPRIAEVLPMTRQCAIWPGASARRSRTGALRQAAARRGKLAFGQATPAHHRHGLQRSAAGPRPLDGTAGGPRSCQATIGPARRPRDHPHLAAPPRPEAVAGKKCGAFRSSMKLTSPAWKMCWKLMRGPTIQRSPLSASGDLHADVRPPTPAAPGREARQDTSMNAAEPPMSSARSSPKRAATSPS